jgi:hypothetical protein
MNKKTFGIALVLFALIAVGVVFAAEYACKDPADGSVRITYSGSTVYASYSGKSAQSFDVYADTKAGMKKVSFSFRSVPKEQTRVQDKDVGAEITRVTDCSFNNY